MGGGGAQRRNEDEAKRRPAHFVTLTPRTRGHEACPLGNMDYVRDGVTYNRQSATGSSNTTLGPYGSGHLALAV